MASRTMKTGDTWPPLKGRAADATGTLDLTVAASLRVVCKSNAFLIDGAAEPIEPPDANGNNWQYVWAAGDTDNAGTYDVELEVTWDAETTPPQIETFPPNVGSDKLILVEDND